MRSVVLAVLLKLMQFNANLSVWDESEGNKYDWAGASLATLVGCKIPLAAAV